MQGEERGIPAWMLEETEYSPEGDRKGFVAKSILKLSSLMSKIREDSSLRIWGVSSQCRLIYTILFILLVACSHNMVFTYIMVAGLLVRLCLLPGKQLKRVVAGAFGAMLLSLILLLPAVFLGSPHSMFTIAIKVFFSVGLVGLLAADTPWNKITGGLRSFHIPGILIFTFDITIKYIVLLGDISLNALQALKLRQVGRFKQGRAKAMGGILGTTFLKSKKMSDEMYDAMVCRGYDGEYSVDRKYSFTPWELLGIGIMAVAVAMFMYFEVLI